MDAKVSLSETVEIPVKCFNLELYSVFSNIMEDRMAALVHVAVGFAAKPLSPKVPVWVMIIAAEVLDIFAILFGLIGVEKAGNNPWTHGLGNVTCVVHRKWSSFHLDIPELSNWNSARLSGL